MEKAVISVISVIVNRFNNLERNSGLDMNLAKYNKIEELKFLSGSLDTADMFNQEYEEMLNLATGDVNMLKAMQGILMNQLCYMINEHISLQIEDRNKNV